MENREKWLGNKMVSNHYEQIMNFGCESKKHLNIQKICDIICI